MHRGPETEAKRLDRLAWQQRLTEIEQERQKAIRLERWRKFKQMFSWRRK